MGTPQYGLHSTAGKMSHQSPRKSTVEEVSTRKGSELMGKTFWILFGVVVAVLVGLALAYQAVAK